MKGSYYNCVFLIPIVTEEGADKLYIVCCPAEWKGEKLMTYRQLKHWEQTGEVEEFKLYKGKTRYSQSKL